MCRDCSNVVQCPQCSRVIVSFVVLPPAKTLVIMSTTSKVVNAASLFWNVKVTHKRAADGSQQVPLAHAHTVVEFDTVETKNRCNDKLQRLGYSVRFTYYTPQTTTIVRTHVHLTIPFDDLVCKIVSRHRRNSALRTNVRNSILLSTGMTERFVTSTLDRMIAAGKLNVVAGQLTVPA